MGADMAMPTLNSRSSPKPLKILDDDDSDASSVQETTKKEQAKAKPIGEYSTWEILQSVDQMSGRMLSKIQGISIETSTEVNDITEKLGLMQMVVEELSSRLDTVS